MSTPAVLGALLLSAALPQTHAANAAQEASESNIVAGRADAYDRLTVPVRIGDHGPFRFVIDTGAQNTVISTALAQQLALVPSATATVVSMAGQRQANTVEIDQIDLGRRSYYGITAPLLDAENIGADGIVGLDSLQGQRVLIDFTRNLMAIGDARTLGGDKGFEIVVTARRRSGQLIITNAMVDGVYTSVVIDTGADSTVANRALQRALAQKHPTTRALLTSVTGQQIVADVGLAGRIAFGRIQINNVLLAYADAPPFTVLDLEKKPAILLGMRDLRGFKRVAIDFAKRKILFDVPFHVNNLPENLRAMTEGYDPDSGVNARSY
ncbi:MAG: aspartyl protease family protein [Novosphingobium sp.]|nr:aspartyl protease family protein [Novosphingobium sp.]